STVSVADAIRSGVVLCTSFRRAMASSICEARSEPAATPRHQRADQDKVHEVEDETGGERGRVIAEVIVEHAGDPAARGHPESAEAEQDRYAPAGLACRKQLAQTEHIGRNDPREAETE